MGSSFSSLSPSNHPVDQFPAGNYVYSQPINITPTSVTPSAQYTPMSTSLGLIGFF